MRTKSCLDVRDALTSVDAGIEWNWIRNACQVLAQGGATLLVAVVGDSLMEPFWPEGTGIGRGFLSVLDTAWLVSRWSQADRSVCSAVW